MKVRLSILLLSIFGSVYGFSQIRPPQTPQFGGFQPVYGNTPNTGAYTPQYQQPGIPTRMGGTAADIINQQSRGIPNGTNAEENQRLTQEYIFEQMRNNPAYNPQFRNPNSRHFRLTPNEELQNMFGHVTPAQLSEKYNSKEFAEKTKSFTDALHSLKNMLSGKRKLSVAEAYFTMENAYGESYLSKEEFFSNLDASRTFIQLWMRQNNLNYNDNEAKHYAIQKFMSERLTVTATTHQKDNLPEFHTIVHDPFFYDFNNYTGEKDNRDFYVTKCMATGMGQCNSMATLYLCLAETIGAKAYLAFAPQHALVKYRDHKGNMRNYEATSNWDITDKWYLDNLFISRKAQQDGVFLSPYNDKQKVANCILDLALGYQRRFGTGDGTFINECIKSAQPFFPKNDNVELYLTYSNMYGNQLGKVLKANKLYRVEDAMKIPEAAALYEKWKKNETIVEALGYNNDPAGLYEEMMKHYEFRGREQRRLHLDGKQKHNLFTTVN